MVRGGPEVTFTRVPPGFHEGSEKSTISPVCFFWRGAKGAWTLKVPTLKGVFFPEGEVKGTG